MRASRIAAGLVIGLAVAACKAKEAPKQPLGMPRVNAPLVDTSPEAIKNNPHRMISPEAKAALDSGNALFRAKDYKGALAKYRAAAKLSPANGAPFYGIYMAADKLGDKALADSAMKEFSRRTEDAGGIAGDSLMKKAHVLDTTPKS
jgi:tetratricopeptide (TPR) repeat protein